MNDVSSGMHLVLLMFCQGHYCVFLSHMFNLFQYLCELTGVRNAYCVEKEKQWLRLLRSSQPSSATHTGGHIVLFVRHTSSSTFIGSTSKQLE